MSKRMNALDILDHVKAEAVRRLIPLGLMVWYVNKLMRAKWGHKSGKPPALGLDNGKHPEFYANRGTVREYMSQVRKVQRQQYWDGEYIGSEAQVQAALERHGNLYSVAERRATSQPVAERKPQPISGPETLDRTVAKLRREAVEAQIRADEAEAKLKAEEAAKVAKAEAKAKAKAAELERWVDREESSALKNATASIAKGQHTWGVFHNSKAEAIRLSFAVWGKTPSDVTALVKAHCKRTNNWDVAYKIHVLAWVIREAKATMNERISDALEAAS